MKTVLVLMAFFILTYSYSQELNIGGIIGTGPKNLNYRIITLGSTVEFRPIESLISINIDPTLDLLQNKVLLTTPLYIKIIIGQKIRFCPTLGGFIRTNANYGWKAGLNIEYKINNSLFIFAMGDFYKDFYKAEAPSHFGPSNYYTESGTSVWLSLGFKKNIYKIRAEH